jgi:hypothetical protein
MLGSALALRDCGPGKLLHRQSSLAESAHTSRDERDRAYAAMSAVALTLR